MLKPINQPAKSNVHSILSESDCGDVCVFCDEPRDMCTECDEEWCGGIPRDYAK